MRSSRHILRGGCEVDFRDFGVGTEMEVWVADFKGKALLLKDGFSDRAGCGISASGHDTALSEPVNTSLQQRSILRFAATIGLASNEIFELLSESALF
mmetsp:Transcript_68504/g.108729  ORF Transcript_68504/g.108729 Transcript_68504/m.108729 type:complete len:98 (+) Transcript_68504:389-682(+)